MKRPAQPAFLEVTQTALTENSDDGEDGKRGHDLEKSIGLFTAGSSYSDQGYRKNSIAEVRAFTGHRSDRNQKYHREDAQQHFRTRPSVFDRADQFAELGGVLGRVVTAS